MKFAKLGFFMVGAKVIQIVKGKKRKKEKGNLP
jgi:hypothetical protein